jgi:hypothetical protein
MPNLKLIYLALVFIFVSSCNPYVGVWRKAQYSKPIDIDCIKKAFLDIEDVEYRYLGEIVRDEDDWGNPIEHSFRFNYKFRGINGTFFFVVPRSKTVEYRHEYTILSIDYSEDRVNDIREFMSIIEKNIEKKCKIKNFAKSVSEKCRVVKCTKL